MGCSPRTFIGWLEKWFRGRKTKQSRGGKSSSKKRVKQKSVSSVTIIKSLHTVERSHNFYPNSSFSARKPSFTPQQLVSPSDNRPSELQCFGCGKAGHWRRNCRVINQKTKEKLKVKLKFAVCSTEKSSEFWSNISSKISVKGRLLQSLD